MHSHHQLCIIQLSALNMEHKRLKLEHSIRMRAFQSGHLKHGHRTTGKARLPQHEDGLRSLSCSPSRQVYISGVRQTAKRSPVSGCHCYLKPAEEHPFLIGI